VEAGGGVGPRRFLVPSGSERRSRVADAHAVELAGEGVPLKVIQRQLGHVNLGVTFIYLHGIDPDEIIHSGRGRR
jgi:integrase/recombinase XerD